MSPSEDAIRDALGLVLAAVNHDGQGAMTILRYGTPADEVACVLAAICRDLLNDVAWLSDEQSGDVLDSLRARHGL